MVFPEAEVVAPASMMGVPLGGSNLTRGDRVTVVCHKPTGAGFTHVDRDTVLTPTDLIVVASARNHIETLAAEVG